MSLCQCRYSEYRVTLTTFSITTTSTTVYWTFGHRGSSRLWMLLCWVFLLLCWVSRRPPTSIKTESFCFFSYRISFHCSLLSVRDRRKIQSLKNQADWLLHNIIPRHVSESLKKSAQYSENHREVGIIFASLVSLIFPPFLGADVVNILQGPMLKTFIQGPML